MIKFTKELLSNFEDAAPREWLVTNGLGGYASSTVIGVNTRRYHGLLVAALAPPTKRFVLVAKLEETLLIHKDRYDLSCNQYTGIIHPDGHKYLIEFRLEPYPIFLYECGKALLEKSIFLVYGENTLVVTYRLISSQAGAAALIVRPLLACRDYHWVSYENNFFSKKVESSDGTLKLRPYEGMPELYLSHNAEGFEDKGYWYRNFEYKREYERGLESCEDLYSPGQLTYLLRENESCAFIASLEPKDARLALDYAKAEKGRHASLLEPLAAAEDFTRTLFKTADSFIVKRSGTPSSVIAGYHWFTDWGRDALVSLPGLALARGRYDIARSILETFGSYCDKGLLPSYFPDGAVEPEYANADVSLWYFYAVGKYLDYTGDLEFVKKRIFGTLLEIIDYYIKGTRFGIHMDKDGLITFEEQRVTLSWMDTMAAGSPCVPRLEKLVEVNALWYNALKVMESIIGEFDKRLMREYESLSKVVRENFNLLFWNEPRHALFDWVARDRKDAAVRANQIFAISLPHTMLTRKRALEILDTVERELLTAYGLRTLSPKEERYHSRYFGGQQARDEASHQGSVWPWLLGHYITAYLKVHTKTKKTIKDMKALIVPLAGHISEAGLESISEIFDADAPHLPNGCISQAWSVAELLRVLHEDLGMLTLKKVEEVSRI